MFSGTCPPSQGPKIDDFAARMKIGPTRAQHVMISKKKHKKFSPQYILYSTYCTVEIVQWGELLVFFLRNHYILCPCGRDLHFFFEVVNFRPLAWRASVRKQSPRSPEGPTYRFLHRILQIQNSVLARGNSSRDRGDPGDPRDPPDSPDRGRRPQIGPWVTRAGISK